MAVFREDIEKKTRDTSESQLIKYAAGKMKDLIINFVQRKKLYGDSHRVIAAYRKRIKEWSQIKHGDAKGYRGFWIFCLNLRPLLSCKHVMFWTLLTWCTCCCPGLGTMGQWENGQMVKAGVINQKIKERYKVRWSHGFCQWWKSYSGMIQSFQKKLLRSILKRKRTKHGKKFSIYVAGSINALIMVAITNWSIILHLWKNIWKSESAF